MYSMAHVVCFVVGLAVIGSGQCGELREKRDDAHKLIVTTIAEEPYVMLVDEHGSGNDNFEGLIPDMLKYISDKLQVNIEIKLVEDGKYGSRNDKGKWNGMIGEILSGKADMAAAPMTISDLRKEVVEFTDSFEDFGTVILMKVPTKDRPNNIKDLDDLAGQTKVKYGIVRDGVTQTFFKSSNEATYKKIWETLEKNPNNMVDKVEDAVEKVRQSNGNFAFIVESATAEYWVNIPPCDLMTVGDRINTNSFAFAMKMGADYKDQIDEVIAGMKTNGEITRLRQTWKKGSCGRKIYVDPTSAAIPMHEVTRQLAVVLGMLSVMLGLL